MGAVMGDKNLKAIAVRGTQDLNIAKPVEFMQLCNDALKYIKVREKNPIPGVMPIVAGLGSPQEMIVHDEKWHTENFVWGNARHRRKGFWTDRGRGAVDQHHGDDADAAPELPQLPAEVRRVHRRRYADSART